MSHETVTPAFVWNGTCRRLPAMSALCSVQCR